jgi:hypothetical protein
MRREAPDPKPTPTHRSAEDTAMEEAIILAPALTYSAPEALEIIETIAQD